MSRQRGFGEYSPIVDFNKAMDEGYKFNRLNAQEKKFIRDNGGTFLKNLWYMIKKHNPITNIIRFWGTLFSGFVGSSGIELLEDQDAGLKNFYLLMFSVLLGCTSAPFGLLLANYVDGLLQYFVNGTRNLSANDTMNKQAVSELNNTYKRFEAQMEDIIRQAQQKKDYEMESRFSDGLKRLRFCYNTLKSNKYLS